MMKIAIALFGTRVSPRFDCAPGFQIVAINNGKVLDSQEVSVEKWKELDRVKKLKELGVDALICGGIDMFSNQQLNHRGIKVYSWITGEAEDALNCLLQGQLQPGYMLAAGGRCCGRWRLRHGKGCQVPSSGTGN